LTRPNQTQEVNVALTEREREVLIGAALGKTSAQIAAVLGVDKDSVDADFENIFKFFGANSRVMAVSTALYQNEVQSPDFGRRGGGVSRRPARLKPA
jgi:DNA-binding CsgD family transcriptional regulator